MIDATYPGLRSERAGEVQAALVDLFDSQQFDVLMARRDLGKRWDARLASRMLELNLRTAALVGDRVAEELGVSVEFNPVYMEPWLAINADLAASAINGSTRAALAVAAEAEAKALVFDQLRNAAPSYAQTAVTTSANLGAHDAAELGGQRHKVWQARPGSLRHGHLSGSRVPMQSTFSNGMRWPGDPSGPADEVAGCKCSLAFDG